MCTSLSLNSLSRSSRRLARWRPALALLVYLALLGLHPVVVGRDPLAGLFRSVMHD